jgi:hypothetical protein
LVEVAHIEATSKLASIVETAMYLFLAKVDANVKEFGYCTVVVSEGTKWADGRFLAEQGTRDDFGHAQLASLRLLHLMRRLVQHQI